MLTLPDFKEKKLLFIHPHQEGEDTDELKLSNDNIALYKQGKCVNQIPCLTVFCVFIVGDTTLTTRLMSKLQEYGISLFVLNTSLKTITSLCPSAKGNYLLRQKQYLLSDADEIKIARLLVNNKIMNQLSLTKSTSELFNIKTITDNISTANIEKLRGFEGSVAAKYFKEVFKDIGWYRRAPQAKEDIPNLLLDIGYTFLFNFCSALLELFGFDTYKGIYHQLYFQRQSLTCDVMEPLRPIIDRRLIKAYHRNEITESDFTFKNGTFNIKDWQRRKKYCDIFSESIMERKEDIYKFIHEFYRHIMTDGRDEIQIFNL